MGKHPEIKTAIAEKLKLQKGKCAWCNLTFQENVILEIDHITPKSFGGKHTKENTQLLHRHCHDIKTKYDVKVLKKEPGKRGAV